MTQRTNLALSLFLYCPQAKNALTFWRVIKGGRRGRERRGRERGWRWQWRRERRRGKKAERRRDLLFSQEPGNKCFGCVGYVVSVRTVQLCHCSTMAVLQKNFIYKSRWWVRFDAGHSFPTPDLKLWKPSKRINWLCGIDHNRHFIFYCDL